MSSKCVSVIFTRPCILAKLYKMIYHGQGIQQVLQIQQQLLARSVSTSLSDLWTWLPVSHRLSLVSGWGSSPRAGWDTCIGGTLLRGKWRWSAPGCPAWCRVYTPGTGRCCRRRRWRSPGTPTCGSWRTPLLCLVGKGSRKELRDTHQHRGLQLLASLTVLHFPDFLLPIETRCLSRYHVSQMWI